MTPQTDIELRFVGPLMPVPNGGLKIVGAPNDINQILFENPLLSEVTKNLPGGTTYEITIRIQAIEQ